MDRSFSPSRTPGSARLQFTAVSQRLRSSSFKKPPEPLRRAVADCLSSSSSSHHGNPSTISSEAARTLRSNNEKLLENPYLQIRGILQLSNDLGTGL